MLHKRNFHFHTRPRNFPTKRNEKNYISLFHDGNMKICFTQSNLKLDAFFRRQTKIQNSNLTHIHVNSGSLQKYIYNLNLSKF